MLAVSLRDNIGLMYFKSSRNNVALFASWKVLIKHYTSILNPLETMLLYWQAKKNIKEFRYKISLQIKPQYF